MKIHALCKQPQQLVNAINQAIEDGDLRTWGIVTDGNKEILYTHTPPQWNERVLLRPNVQGEKVSFVVTWWQRIGEPDEATKGYILGRFTEVLMVHFKEYFDYLVTFK